VNPRDTYRTMSGLARGTLLIAAALWAITVFAVISMIRGNPTAINGVVSFGLGGTMMAAAGIGFVRQDIRFPERGDHHDRP